MWYGNLELICGPMFAGKSTELLKRAFWARDVLGRKIVVLKPAIDDRYGVGRIVSHDGLALDAQPITAFPRIPNGTDLVFIDEVQFMMAPHFDGDLVAEVRALLQRGIDVVAGGLDCDWRGHPFMVTAALAAMADSVMKLRSECKVCGRPATKNFKKIPNDVQIEVGQGDKYEARCNNHWHDHSRPNVEHCGSGPVGSTDILFPYIKTLQIS